MEKGECLQQRHGTVNAEDPTRGQINPEGLSDATRQVEIRSNLQALLSQSAANQFESFLERLLHDEGYGLLIAGHRVTSYIHS
jgi:hypothetical protein